MCYNQSVRITSTHIMAVVIMIVFLACGGKNVEPTIASEFTAGFINQPTYSTTPVKISNIYREDDKNPKDCKFDNPAGSALSMDGKYLFISNSAAHNNNKEKFGWEKGNGFITRLEKSQAGWEVQECEVLTQAYEHFFTGPLGLATIRMPSKPNGTFKKGAIFVADGSMPMTDVAGYPHLPANLARIIAFNPNMPPKSSAPNHIYGQIRLGTNSPFEKATGRTVYTPNGLAFDENGNLYLTDTAFSTDPAIIKDFSGVWKIPFQSLEYLAGVQSYLALKAKPAFVQIPGHPWGLWVKGEEIWVGTIGDADKNLGGDLKRGAIYKLRAKDFVSGITPKPIHTDLGALMGLCFIEETMLAAEIHRHPPSACVLAVSNGGIGPISLMRLPTFPQKLNELTNPGHMAIERQKKGQSLLIVPELNQVGGIPPDHVTFIEMPVGFGAP